MNCLRAPVMRPRRVTRAVAATAVVLLMLAGCGSDGYGESTTSDTTSAATSAWADGVCSSITTWKSAVVAAAGSALSGGLDQQSLQDAADRANAATDTFESDLGDLGVPETASGDQAKTTVDELARQLRAGTESIRSTIDGVSGLGDVGAAAGSVRSTLGTMQDQAATAAASLRQLDPGGELASAFESSAACQQLVSPTPTST